MADREFKPAACAADVSDWITPEDVVRLALGAFYGECARWRSAPDPDFVEDSDPTWVFDWYTRAGFADGLAQRLSEKLLAHAHAVGVRPDSRCAALEQHKQDFPDWVTPFEWPPVEVSHG